MDIGLQDALLHFNKGLRGSWYGWIDSADGEVYSNLKLINDDATMPTEEEVNAKIAELQANLDYQNLDYVKNRQSSYPSIAEQLDDMFHNGFDAWKETIQEVKDKYPKS